MAVAGFKSSNIEIVLKENALTVKSISNPSKPEDSQTLIYKGIAQRNFERRFQLADHIKVDTANLTDGLLTIKLVRQIPEEKKATKININSSPLIEEQAA